MQSIVQDRLARLWAYVKSRTAVTSTIGSEQRSSRVPIPQTSHSRIPSVFGTATRPTTSVSAPHDRDIKAGLSQVVDTSFNISDEVPVLTSGQKGPASGRREGLCGRKRFVLFQNAICMTCLFVWTVVWTLIVITGSAASLLIPDKCRRMRDIGNDVVLVTNAGRGLGRRLAIYFSLKAALVVCWDPDSDRHMNTVYDIRHRGGRALGFTVDVTDETAVTNAAELMRKQVGSPDMLVMSAGRRSQRPLLHWHPEDLEKMYHVNVTPHLILLRTFLPEMLVRNSGHLVCIISASASVPCDFDAPYAATKVGVAALMRGLADELELQPGNKIRLTCVYPCHTARRPPLAKTAEIVVNQVLRGRNSVVVPRCSLFWLGFLQTLPAPARRGWRRFLSRLYKMNGSKMSFEDSCPWGETCPQHFSTVASRTSFGKSFSKCAPYEASHSCCDKMASFTSFDDVPLVLKKRQNYIIENHDD